MTYSQLGWLNVIILGVLVTPYLINFVNKKFIKSRDRDLISVVRFFRKLHKPLGISLMILGLIHGHLALGRLRLHTGTLLYLSIFITSSLGGSFYRLKKRHLFLWHKRMAFITAALFFLHLLYPSALYFLLDM